MPGATGLSPVFLPASGGGRFKPSAFIIQDDGWLVWDRAGPSEGCDDSPPKAVFQAFLQLAENTWGDLFGLMSEQPLIRPSLLWKPLIERMSQEDLRLAFDAVESFVKRFGMLELLEPQEDPLHSPSPEEEQRQRSGFDGFLVGDPMYIRNDFVLRTWGGGRQRVEWYWHYASQLKAIQHLTAELGKRKTKMDVWALARDEPFAETIGRFVGQQITEPWLGHEPDFSVLAATLMSSEDALRFFNNVPDADNPLVRPRLHPDEISVATRRELLGDIIDNWLRRGDVRLQLTWDRQQARPQFGMLKRHEGGLLGTLAQTLALLLVQGDSGHTAVCFHCNATFSSDRKPRRDQTRHFCPACRKLQQPAKYRMRDLRKRQATAEKKGRR